MRLHSGEQGFVSLLTTIILSLLLLVITLSMVTLESLQLRKAEDSEQTLRAYYTAEAGVEDAVGKVLSLGAAAATSTCNSNVPTTASPTTGFDVTGQAGWTCQQISFTGNPVGTLSTPDQASTVDPQGGMFHSVIVEFSLDANTISNCYYTFNCNLNPPFTGYPGSGFPDAATFQANPKAAPVEVSVVQYPDNGFASSSVCTTVSGAVWSPPGCTVKVQNALIVPGGPGGAGTIDYSQPLAGGQPFQATCNTANSWALPGGLGGATDGQNSYHCEAVIQNLPSGCAAGNCNYLFRLRSRFGASAYKLVFMSNPNGGGNSVAVNTGAALIDVTAKAGQTFRRVIYRLPPHGQTASGLNYVMYSDSDICKNFTVIDNTAQAPYPCP